MNDKLKIKVTRDQLHVLYSLVNDSILLKPEDMLAKLIHCKMIEIHKKILLKWTYPQRKNTITLTSAQAIAFWFMYHDCTDEILNSDPFLFSTINPILTTIHQQYV